MTNERITFPTDLDADSNFDDLLTLAHDLELIPAMIEYIFDDAHADPNSYLPNSTTFMTTNVPSHPRAMTLDDDTFYTRFESDALTITFRMIIEMIAHEMMHPALDD
jgi:hypothetical protein